MAPEEIDWAHYRVTLSWDEPKEVVGRLLAVRPVDGSDGMPIPELTLRLRDGTTAVLVASQARLLALLNHARPRIGDVLTITYHGADQRAVKGKSPTKRFSLQVTPRKDTE